MERNLILNNLIAANNIELYKKYVIACKYDMIYGLEYVARELNMKYLFRLDDDTVISESKDKKLII